MAYWERRAGGGGFDGRRNNVTLPPEAVYVPQEPLQTNVDLEIIRSQAIMEMAEASGATSEEVEEGLKYLKSHPQFADAIRSDFNAVFKRVQGLSPSALREIIEDEVHVLAEKNPDPTAIQRLQKEGVLVPVLMTKQATELVEAEGEVKNMAKKKVGRIKTSKRSARYAVGGSAAGITLGAAYLDLTFSKQGLGNIVDVVVDKLGIDWVMQHVGRAVSMNGTTMSVVEQAAYGKGVVTLSLVLGALGYLGHEKWKAEKFFDLFRFRKHPMKATINSALVAMFLGLGSGGVTTQVTEAPRAGALASRIKDKFEPTAAKLGDAVKSARGLRDQVSPIITQRVERAFNTGRAAVGPLTAATWCAFNGDVPNESGQTISQRYEGRDRSKLDLILAACRKINALPEYAAIGMKEKDGARQLLHYLTEPLPKDAEALGNHFKTMLDLSNERANVSLIGAIFGKINPFSASFWRSSVGMETLFRMQEQYPKEYATLIQKVQGLQVINTYLSALQAELKNGPAKVSVDLSLQLALPSLGYTSEEIQKLTIPREDFRDVLEPNKVDAIVNLFWGTSTAWKARQDIVARDLVQNRMGDSDGSTEVLLQRLSYEGAIYSAFLFLVIGSILISGSLRKKLNRWYEADMDAYTEKLSAKEDELINGIIAYAQALSAESSAVLRQGGEQANANNLIGDPFRKAVSVALRKHVAERVTDPRSGKPLSQSIDAEAFIDREQGIRHFDDEERQKILRSYESKLSEWQDTLAENPFATISELMNLVDPAFRKLAQALLTANSTNPGTRERELAIESLRNAFNERERGLMSLQADRVAAHIARLQARREAVQQMAGSESDIEVVLGTETPKFSQKELIASFILADIDTEIHTWQHALDSLTQKGAIVGPISIDLQQLTNAEWKSEQDAFLRREIERFAAGTEIEAEGGDLLEKINEFVDAIGKGIVPIQRELDAHLKTFNPSSTLTFVYGYHPLREGPTISALLTDSSSSDIAPVRIPFTYKIPSEQGRDTHKVLADVRGWARPDGPLAQRLRVSTLFEKMRADYRSQLDQLHTLNANRQYDADIVKENAPLFDSFMRTVDMKRNQEQLMEKLITGGTLSPEDVRVFTEPLAAIRDIWRRSINDAIDRSKTRRFANMGDQRLMVGFFANDEGYIFSVPRGIAEPIDIDTVPEADKLLIKRAAVV
jgi:hypothetical protein